MADSSAAAGITNAHALDRGVSPLARLEKILTRCSGDLPDFGAEALGLVAAAKVEAAQLRADVVDLLGPSLALRAIRARGESIDNSVEKVSLFERAARIIVRYIESEIAHEVNRHNDGVRRRDEGGAA